MLAGILSDPQVFISGAREPIVGSDISPIVVNVN